MGYSETNYSLGKSVGQLDKVVEIGNKLLNGNIQQNPLGSLDIYRIIAGEISDSIVSVEMAMVLYNKTHLRTVEVNLEQAHTVKDRLVLIYSGKVEHTEWYSPPNKIGEGMRQAVKILESVRPRHLAEGSSNG